MSTQALVPMPAMTPVVRRVRVYFAPVGRASNTPAGFDAALAAGFDPEAPPSPWLDLGWVDGFTRGSQSAFAAVHAGRRRRHAVRYASRWMRRWR